MSRDLEREYRAFVDSEVPVLWTRIEAGLEDKKPASENVRTDLRITDFPVTDTPTENTRDRKVKYKVWAGVAAACVCAVLIVPAMVRNVGIKGESGQTADTAPQAAGAYEAADTAKQEAAACEEEVNAAAADGSDSEKSVVSGMDAAVDTANGGMAMEEGAWSEPGSFHATVEILDMDVSMDSGILYTAKILSSDQPGIETDSEIQIFCSIVSSESMDLLELDQTYDLMLREVEPDAPGQEVTYLLVVE